MCSTCDKTFARKHQLLDHEATHSEERKFECKVCPDKRSFKTKSQLSNHMQYHYEPKHCWIKCDKKCHTSSDLNKHMKSHSDERKFKCMVCPDKRSFKTQNALSRHMKYHYEPKCPCTKCGKKFHTASNLKQHMKFHFKPTYSCGKCDKKFYTSAHLKRHEKGNVC